MTDNLPKVLKQVSGSSGLHTYAVSPKANETTLKGSAISKKVNTEKRVKNLIFVDHLMCKEFSLWKSIGPQSNPT